MRRREFLALCGASAVAPNAALSQDIRAVPQVGVLMDFTEADTEGQRRIAAFRSGLNPRTSVAVRWSAGDPVQTGLLAQELVGMAPQAILASGGTAADALIKLT